MKTINLFKDDVSEGDIICGFSLGAIVAAHHANVVPSTTKMVLFGINPLPDDKTKASARYELQTDVNNLGGRLAMKNRLPNLCGLNPKKFAPEY